MTTFQKNSNVDYPCVKSRCYEDLRPKKKWKFSYKVDIKAVDENAPSSAKATAGKIDFDDLSIEDQKRFLLECLDKNHLYVNYSEIDDERIV